MVAKNQTQIGFVQGEYPTHWNFLEGSGTLELDIGHNLPTLDIAQVVHLKGTR